MKTKAKSRSLTTTAVASDPRWARIVARDRSADGRFWYSVATTGVYCRPSCASRRALRKSVPLHELQALAGIKGVQLVSLANSVHGSQAGSLNALDLIDFSEDLIDLAETAALMKNLDLVITIDTSLAHLAGAMGCKVWMPLCWDADWRWGENDLHSYWYQDVTMVRQEVAGEWAPVVKTLARELNNFAKTAGEAR